MHSWGLLSLRWALVTLFMLFGWAPVPPGAPHWHKHVTFAAGKLSCQEESVVATHTPM